MAIVILLDGTRTVLGSFFPYVYFVLAAGRTQPAFVQNMVVKTPRRNVWPFSCGPGHLYFYWVGSLDFIFLDSPHISL